VTALDGIPDVFAALLGVCCVGLLIKLVISVMLGRG